MPTTHEVDERLEHRSRSGPRPACPTRPTPSFPKLVSIRPVVGGGLGRAGAVVAHTSATAPALGLACTRHTGEFVTAGACLYDLPAVGRRRLVVSVLFALSGLGWAAACAVAHRAVMSDPDAPSMADQYLGYLATSLALCFALALPLAAGALIGKRWRGASLQSLWLFGLVPCSASSATRSRSR